jgi:hypothetical protein
MKFGLELAPHIVDLLPSEEWPLSINQRLINGRNDKYWLRRTGSCGSGFLFRERDTRGLSPSRRHCLFFSLFFTWHANLLKSKWNLLTINVFMKLLRTIQEYAREQKKL